MGEEIKLQFAFFVLFDLTCNTIQTVNCKLLCYICKILKEEYTDRSRLLIYELNLHRKNLNSNTTIQIITPQKQQHIYLKYDIIKTKVKISKTAQSQQSI